MPDCFILLDFGAVVFARVLIFEFGFWLNLRFGFWVLGFGLGVILGFGFCGFVMFLWWVHEKCCFWYLGFADGFVMRSLVMSFEVGIGCWKVKLAICICA